MARYIGNPWTAVHLEKWMTAHHSPKRKDIKPTICGCVEKTLGKVKYESETPAQADKELGTA